MQQQSSLAPASCGTARPPAQLRAAFRDHTLVALQAKETQPKQPDKSGSEVPGAAQFSREHPKRPCGSSAVGSEEARSPGEGSGRPRRASAAPGNGASPRTAAGGGFGPYHAGDGPVALHHALGFLVARADLAVGAASHRLALAAGDLIPDKAGFTSPALVGSLQERARGN